MGRDFAIYSLIDGEVKFEKVQPNKQQHVIAAPRARILRDLATLKY